MIDVLIPAFNAEATVRESISSILAQDFRDLRVIVVDDGSTDGTAAILDDLARADARMVVIRKENGGIVDALNLGLRHCRAEFVARHDADDIAYTDRFTTQLAYLRTNPDCVAVGVNAHHIDDRGRPTGTRTWMWGDAPADPTSAPSVEPYILHPFLMVRREALQAVDGYRHVLHAEDTDLYWRLREVGRLHNLRAISGEYRIHSGSITSRSVANARIGAATSQLAAISATRRAAGKRDLDFAPDARDRYQAASDLRSVLAIASEQLSKDEIAYLELAAAAKLIELRGYRRFKFALSDVVTVGSILGRGVNRLTWSNRRRIARMIAYQLRPKFGIKRILARRAARIR